ncbi:MAG TPA: molybdopterin-binding protein [Clostridia bacterium]|nr:molybdopterin-binding protein [Clostridia bacterium]
MKSLRVEDAVGTILAHDLTKIVPGEFKGAAFKKGHVIRPEDIDELKKMGKNNIYVLEMKPEEIHEDEAAVRIAEATAGDGVRLEGPSEGKISFKAAVRGLLKINLEALEAINDIDMVIISTLHNNTVVNPGKNIAGTRIIPLCTDKRNIEAVEEICRRSGKVVWIKELASLKAGVIVTGTEVYEGRIKDKFGPVLAGKLADYGCTLDEPVYTPDNKDRIKAAIDTEIKGGAQIVLVSGGMSVDADDVTPSAIREVADHIVTYGSPVLPGAMFMLGYKKDVPILGIPACGMYHKITVFDLVFPRILAGEVLTRKDIAGMGHGGLCQNCESCRYPNCTFGR